MACKHQTKRIYIYGATDYTQLSGSPLFFYEYIENMCKNEIEVLKIELERLHRLPVLSLKWLIANKLSARTMNLLKLSQAYHNKSYSKVSKKRKLTNLRGNVVAFSQILPKRIITAANSGEIKLWPYIDLTLNEYFATYGFGNAPNSLKDALMAQELQCYKSSQKIFCFHDGVKYDLVKHYGVPPEKIVVSGSGVNLSMEDIRKVRDARGRRSENKESKKRVVLCFIGRDFVRKGLIKIVEGLDRVIRETPAEVELHVMGPSKRRIPERPYIKSHGFIDKQTEKEKFLDVISQCDFGCLLSSAEGFPGSLLEFLSCGIPVISSNLPQVVKRLSGRGAQIVDVSNTVDEFVEFVTKVASDPDERIQFENAAKQYCDDYTWRHPCASVLKAIFP